MRHKTRLFEQFDAWTGADVGVVLAIVIQTGGSTYSKPGDFMLITSDGRYQGLVSGGCVEGDLAIRARDCARSQTVVAVDYDLGGEHDALWGMGAGCDGTLKILLVPLHAVGVLHQVIESYRAHAASVLAFEWQSEDCRLVAVIDSAATDTDSLTAFGRSQLHAQRSVFELSAEGGRGALFIKPAPRVLLCGAGADAVPLAEFLAALGWRVHVCDHRSAYIDEFPTLPGVTKQTLAAEHLSAHIDIAAFEAAMVMSHHLQTDATLLSQLASRGDWAYIAVLGPAHRRQRLLDMLDADHVARLAPVLHGPAGLHIGGREPVSIALSIAAQMHQSLAESGVLDSTANSAQAIQSD